ncbi:MAG: lysophospholipid acyltransferase family protein [Bacteroidia bacterium]
MLYAFLKIVMQVTVRIFFRSITVRNKELIPSKGPLMVLVNHPSTFMDPIVVATMLDREVYFLAKGSLFNNSFSRWLLPKFNIIPVYRQKDDPSLMDKNKETFAKCFEHLEKGGVLLIFPEGTSITERKLRPVKTGAARISLGAEAQNDFRLGVNIVTIGLNYANPHKFNRDLFINIDAPISTADYKESYKTDEYVAVESLTEQIRQKLEKLIIAIEDDKTDELVKNIELIYKYKLSRERGISKKDKDADFALTKGIVDAVYFYQQNYPERVELMHIRINEYLNNLNRLGLTDTDLARNQKSNSFVRSNLQALLIIVLGFPIYVYGVLNNFLPFEIPGRIARKMTSSIEFVGAIGMVGGIFSFSLFYSVQIVLVWKFTHIAWLTVAYGFSLPLSGFFAYWYYHTIHKIRTKWMLLMLFYKKSVFISNLINEREQIISEFDKIKNEYADLAKTA